MAMYKQVFIFLIRDTSLLLPTTAHLPAYTLVLFRCLPVVSAVASQDPSAAMESFFLLCHSHRRKVGRGDGGGEALRMLL